MIRNPGTRPRVVVRDSEVGRWLEFSSPRLVLSAARIEEVLPLLRRIEQEVEGHSRHAAGFISYEAAPAFDPALPAQSDGEFPLAWFGIFSAPAEIALLPGGNQPGADISWQPSVTPEQYRRCVRRIKEHIRAGDTYQVNFTYRLRAQTDADPWRLFLELAGDGRAPFAAFVDTGEWAVCSASPELFLRLDGEEIESRPMKGTAPRGLWPEQDRERRSSLVRSEKERAENVMIVDMVRNDLGRAAFGGSVRVPELFEAERYPAAWQMTSTVSARTHEPLSRILQAAFPPASITGAPKRRTMEIIAELECSPRRVYTGAIGFVSPGRRARFNVAIRTVLLHKPTGRAEFGLGGGILWDSRPESEYAECLTKAGTLAPLPRDFDLLETLLWTPGGGYALLEYHLRRLEESADYFDIPAELEKIRQELERIASGLPAEPHRVRLLVSGAGFVRGRAAPLDPAAGFGRVALAAGPVDAKDVFLYHKTTRRGVYEEALRQRPGSDEVLLYNADGEITESVTANVAVELAGSLWTPPLRCGLLPGTQRAFLLERGRLRERVISVEAALAAPKIYLFNSVRGMREIRLSG